MGTGARFGDYTLFKKLAQTSTAEVFLARHAAGAGEWVVVKRVLPLVGRDPEVARMFLEAARISAQLQHPFLTRVHQLGRVDDALFLSMEYVHGVTVARLVEDLRLRRQKLPWPLAARVAVQLCEALEYVHRARSLNGEPLHLVHCDVTPRNAMLSFSGVVKLLDFGIARATHRWRAPADDTLHVSPEYGAPELFRHEQVDGRTDVYGVALLLFEALAGVHPFQRDTIPETVNAILEHPRPKLTVFRKDLPKPLLHAVHRGLAVRMADRPPDARALRTLLEEALRTHAEPVGIPELADWMESVYPGSTRLQRERSAGPTEVTLRTLAPDVGSAATPALDRTTRPDDE